MPTYKLQARNGEVVAILRDNHWSIPFDLANTDYQEYLRWLELGNTPEPADNPPTE